MKPNLSLYNKQWGERWSVRRQLRTCAFLGNIATNWTSVWANHAGTKKNPPNRDGRVSQNSLAGGALTASTFTTDHDSQILTSFLPQKQNNLMEFQEKSTMPLNTNTVLCALKVWRHKHFPPGRAWERRTVTEHVTERCMQIDLLLT